MIASLLFIPFGAAVLFSTLKVADFAEANRRICIEFDMESENAQPESPSKAYTSRLCKNEPYSSKISKFIIDEALKNGTYKVGVGNAAETMRKNNVLPYCRIKQLYNSRKATKIRIMALNHCEYDEMISMMCTPAELGALMMYMHSLDRLEVVKCYG
ncbi:MAG: hypothetical protein ACP5K5_01875 [Candidatus Micrarchaeia archaeon]